MSTLEPNMNLILTTIGVDSGLLWEQNTNSNVNIIGGHTHLPGSGVPITSGAISINADLPMNAFNLTLIRSLRFSPQITALSGASDIGCLYEVGVDLYYNDGSGNQVRITQGGSVTGSSGTITGLPSGTASASYSGGTFTFQSATNTPATMDIGTLIIRNTTASANGVTITPINALGAGYNLVLPTLPASQKIMTLDSSGNMTAPYTVDGTTLTITANVISVGIIGTGNIAALSITDALVAANTLTADKFSTTILGKSLGTAVQSYTAAGTYTWTVPSPTGEATIFVVVEAVGAGAGGSGNGAGGSGGDTTFNGITICQGAGKAIPYGFYSGGAAGNHAGQASQGFAGGTSGGSGGGGGGSTLGAGGTGGSTNGAGGNGTGNGSGGGGGGAAGTGGTGGNGANSQVRYFNLTAGASITVVVGAGGTGAGAGGGFATSGNGADGAINIYY